MELEMLQNSQKLNAHQLMVLTTKNLNIYVVIVKIQNLS